MQPSVAKSNPVAQPAGGFPRLTITRLTARRASRGALLWGLVFGLFVLELLIEFGSGYPTPESREALARSVGDNPGMQALFGESQNVPGYIDSAPGYTEYHSSFLAVFGVVWALFAGARLTRGEEERGRWELLLSGLTTRRQGATEAIGGLGLSLVVLWGVTAAITEVARQFPEESFSFASGLYLALALVGPAAVAMATVAFTSQLLPTRRAAVAWAAVAMGAMYLARSVADVSPSLRWLRTLTPLGWVEDLHPLHGNGQPFMLFLLGAFILALSVAAVYLAGRRDLGAGYLHQRSGRQARTRLLGGPFGLAVRLLGPNLIGWSLALGTIGFLFSLTAKQAAEAFSQSELYQRLFGIQGAQVMGVESFLGFIFLILMTLVTLYSAAQAAATRREESLGYADNLLARPISRVRWLGERFLVSLVGVVVLGLVTGVLSWAAAAAQGTGVTLPKLLIAGLNTAPPAIFVLGIGTLCHGLLPRVTSLVAYGIVAWSFLVEMLGRIINVSSTITNLSLFDHVALAPAVEVRLGHAAALLALGLGAALLGLLFFNRRDLAGL